MCAMTYNDDVRMCTMTYAECVQVLTPIIYQFILCLIKRSELQFSHFSTISALYFFMEETILPSVN